MQKAGSLHLQRSKTKKDAKNNLITFEVKQLFSYTVYYSGSIPFLSKTFPIRIAAAFCTLIGLQINVTSVTNFIYKFTGSSKFSSDPTEILKLNKA